MPPSVVGLDGFLCPCAWQRAKAEQTDHAAITAVTAATKVTTGKISPNTVRRTRSVVVRWRWKRQVRRQPCDELITIVGYGEV